MRILALAALASSIVMLTVSHARAQSTAPGVVPTDRVAPTDLPKPVVDPTPPLGILPSHEDPFMDPRMTRSWAAAPSRAFIASTFDIGFVYLRPRVSVGYGKPFTSWIGFEANPIAQSTGLGAYGGVRIEIPYVDLRIGPRFFYSFNRSYMDQKPSYVRLDVESDSGARTKIVTYETELDAAIPAGPGNFLLRGSVSYVTGVPDGQAAFEETLHVIVHPPWILRARGGYAFRLGAQDQHSIGMVVDVLDVPKRNDAITVRVGPIMRMVLSRRVELRAIFAVSVVSPDNIGLVGGDFAELGVRYRWASE